MKRILCFLLVMALTLFMVNSVFPAQDAGITSSSSTWTIQKEHSSYCTDYGKYFRHCWGVVIDSVQVDSGDTGARDVDTCVLATMVDVGDWEYMSAWVNCTSLHDSLYTVATLLDTLRIIFQTSWDGETWLDLTGAESDTTISSTSTVAMVAGHARTDAASTKPFGRYLRVMSIYNLAAGAQTGEGCQTHWPVTYKFGYAFWNTYKSR